MEFVRLRSFENAAAGLMSEHEIFELELALLLNPAAGDVIPGAKGLRKLRRARRGAGKRGGLRVIYYHILSPARILLLYVYTKNQQGDLTVAQTRQLARLVQEEFP